MQTVARGFVFLVRSRRTVQPRLLALFQWLNLCCYSFMTLSGDRASAMLYNSGVAGVHHAIIVASTARATSVAAGRLMVPHRC